MASMLDRIGMLCISAKIYGGGKIYCEEESC